MDDGFVPTTWFYIGLHLRKQIARRFQSRTMASQVSLSTKRQSLDRLSSDVWCLIFAFLRTRDLFHVYATTRFWRQISVSPGAWSNVHVHLTRWRRQLTITELSRSFGHGNLTRLDVRRCDRLTPDALNVFDRSHLTSLLLSHISCIWKGLCYLKVSRTTLRRLHLDNTDMDDLAAGALADLFPHLQTLSLNSNRWLDGRAHGRDKRMNTLGLSQLSQLQELKILRLNQVPLQSVSFLNSFEHHATLERFHISNFVSRPMARFSAQLAHIVGSWPRLRVLSAKGNLSPRVGDVLRILDVQMAHGHGANKQQENGKYYYVEELPRLICVSQTDSDKMQRLVTQHSDRLSCLMRLGLWCGSTGHKLLPMVAGCLFRLHTLTLSIFLKRQEENLDALRHVKSLTHLSLALHHFKCDDLFSFVSDLAQLQSLTLLDAQALSGNGQRARQSSASCSSQLWQLRHAPKLQQLKLMGLAEADDTSLLDVVPHLCCLCDLSFYQDTHLTDSHLQPLRNNKQLERLALHGCLQLTRDGVRAVVQTMNSKLVSCVSR